MGDTISQLTSKLESAGSTPSLALSVPRTRKNARKGGFTCRGLLPHRSLSEKAGGGTTLHLLGWQPFKRTRLCVRTCWCSHEAGTCQ